MDWFFDYLLKILLYLTNAFIRGLILLAEKIYDLVVYLIEYGESSGSSKGNHVSRQGRTNFGNPKTNPRYVSQNESYTENDEALRFDKNKIILLDKKMHEAKMLMYIFIIGAVMFVGISLFFYIDSGDTEGAMAVALFAVVSILISFYQNHRRNKLEEEINLEFLNK